MAGTGSDATGIVRHAEQASATNEWVPVSRIRMTRRIVTEIQAIEVEVRREELVVTEEPIPASSAVSLPAGQAPVTPEPRIFVLRAEVPSVSLTILPVERVTVTPVIVAGKRELTLDLASEHLGIRPEPPSVHETEGTRP